MLTPKRTMLKVRSLILILVVTLCFAVAHAQTRSEVEVTRNVNLRPDPSSHNKPIELIRPPERLELIEPEAQNGYYHVRAEEGEEGWVWRRNVHIIQPLESSEMLTEATATASVSISPNWAKPTPNKTTFHGIEGDCPFNGNGSDPVQFMLKNRSDIPTSYHDVTWSAINDLDYPGKSDQNYAPPHRKDWTPEQLAVLQPYEGIPVRVVGYIVAIKPQNGGNGEGTNCKFNLTLEV